MMSPRLNIAIEGEGRPFSGWGERDAIDENVIPDEEGFDHRSRWDLEVLKDKGHDEETDGEHAGDGGQRFERSLCLLSLRGRFFFLYGIHRLHRQALSTCSSSVSPMGLSPVAFRFDSFSRVQLWLLGVRGFSHGVVAVRAKYRGSSAAAGYAASLGMTPIVGRYMGERVG